MENIQGIQERNRLISRCRTSVYRFAHKEEAMKKNIQIANDQLQGRAAAGGESPGSAS